jgi:hypothetical protein
MCVCPDCLINSEQVIPSEVQEFCSHNSLNVNSNTTLREFVMLNGTRIYRDPELFSQTIQLISECFSVSQKKVKEWFDDVYERFATY